MEPKFPLTVSERIPFPAGGMNQTRARNDRKFPEKVWPFITPADIARGGGTAALTILHLPVAFEVSVLARVGHRQRGRQRYGDHHGNIPSEP